jgi:hypothetical protein
VSARPVDAHGRPLDAPLPAVPGESLRSTTGWLAIGRVDRETLPLPGSYPPAPARPCTQERAPPSARRLPPRCFAPNPQSLPVCRSSTLGAVQQRRSRDAWLSGHLSVPPPGPAAGNETTRSFVPMSVAVRRTPRNRSFPRRSLLGFRDRHTTEHLGMGLAYSEAPDAVRAIPRRRQRWM